MPGAQHAQGKRGACFSAMPAAHYPELNSGIDHSVISLFKDSSYKSKNESLQVN
jgi:hypothetical protein